MARNPNLTINFGYRDRSRERTGFSIPIADDIDTIGEAAEFVAFTSALANVIDGLHTSTSFGKNVKITNAIQATAGQREEKWLLTYQDNVTLHPYQTELPCRKSSVQPPAGSDFVDLTAVPWAAFKTAFEGLASSPDGNAVTLLSVELMGKNL